MLEFKHDLLPSECFVFVEGEPIGHRIRKAKLGMAGHWGNGYHHGDIPTRNLKADAVRELVRELNRDLGVTALQEDCMQAGSCFGWDTPAADPTHLLQEIDRFYTGGGAERVQR